MNVSRSAWMCRAIVIALAVLGIAAPRAAAAGSITVTKAGAGSGTVTSEPAGINCGAVCTATFAANQGIGLTATPDAGSRLASWSGPCSTSKTNLCTLPAPIPASIVATFVKTATLTVAKAGNATGHVTSDPAGIFCGVTCAYDFDQGSTVTLTASSQVGDGTFTGWSGGGCSGTGTCTVTMDQAKTVTATFQQPYGFEVSVDPTGTGSGRITSSPAGIDCTSTCFGAFFPGTTVTLTITPDGESRYSWGSACSGSGTTPGTCTFTMDAQKRVDVRFDSYRRITVASTGSGSGRLKSTGGAIDCGAVCTETLDTGLPVSFHQDDFCVSAECVLALPDVGSRFAGWSGIGCSALPAPSCDLNLDSDVTLTATFVKQQTLAVTKDGTGTGSVGADGGGLDCGGTCSASYDQGSKVTLTATPDAKTRFAGWSGGGCSGTGTCTVTLDAATSVKATFNAGATVSVENVGYGSGTVTSSPPGIDCPRTCSALFDKGSKVVLTSTPDAGSAVAYNAVDGGCDEGFLATTTCTFTVGGDRHDSAGWYIPRTLTVVKAGSGSGTVTGRGFEFDCGTACSATLAQGQAVSLDAKPAAGSRLAGWSGGGCSGTDTSCDLAIDADTSVTVTFEKADAATPTPTPAATPSPSPSPSPSVESAPAPSPPATAVTPPAHLVVDTRLLKSKVTRAKRTATFTFVSVGGAKRFQCALAKQGKRARFATCTSPKTYKRLARGTYTFQVRAAGDTTPAGKRFKM
jgi:hypothetical protein